MPKKEGLHDGTFVVNSGTAEETKGSPAVQENVKYQEAQYIMSARYLFIAGVKWPVEPR